ncbi:unnamed protein product [Rotaria magnacalcarata]
MAQIDTILVFCLNTDRHKVWTKNWSKVKGVHGSIKSICKQLTKATRSCDHTAIPMSFVPKQNASDTTSSAQKLDQLPPIYMYSVIFKDIILEIDDDDAKSMNTLVNFCRQHDIPENEINEFKQEYYKRSPIWWYTKEMFLYGMLHRALRVFDMEVMTKLGFFIRHLHLQLAQLHQERSSNFQKVFTVYRGQALSQMDFQNLLDSKGGLLSFNNFLLTTKNREVAMRFVEDVMQRNQDTVGVFFIMTIDQSKISTASTPFAMIDQYAAIKGEQEILFAMNTVFRVVESKQTTKNNRLWEIQLSITDEGDPQLASLTNCIKEEVDGEGWYRMGKLMLKVGHFNQAEELYNELLENALNDSDRAHVYHQLGLLKNEQGKYQEAATFYDKSLEIKWKTLPKDDASLTNPYNNIGLVYQHMGDYSKALEYYQRALKIKEKALHPIHPDLATSYNNIGSVYNDMGDYSNALKFYEKSLKIRQTVLPSTHPDLATSYNSIGEVYQYMCDYSKALEYYEMALQIRQIALPPNHPDLATSYNSIGGVSEHMVEYSKALDYYEIALKIRQTALPPTHPDLATSYNIIGIVYQHMGDYLKALEYYEMALQIRQIVLPSNHSDLATSYNSMGSVYSNMGDYSKALDYHNKALKIREIALPPNHPDLATSYNSIGMAYSNKGDKQRALQFLANGLAIRQKSLPSTHPLITKSINNMNYVKKMP